MFCSITPTNLGQFSKPGTNTESAGPDNFKTPLHVQFDQVLAEIFEVKNTQYPYFISMIINLTEWKIKI